MLQELDSDNDEAEGNPCVGKRGVRSFLWPLCFIGRIGEMRSEARAVKHRDMATHLEHVASCTASSPTRSPSTPHFLPLSP